MDLESLDCIVDKIVSNSGKAKEEVLKLINTKFEEYEGLLTKDGAALLVAKELNLNVFQSPVIISETIEIGKINKSFGSVTVRARIISTGMIKEFQRRDGTIGKHCSFFIADKTGKMRFVLWNEQTEMVLDPPLRKGSIIEIRNAYPKTSNYGALELHSGNKTDIELLDEEEQEEDFPLPKIERLTIKELSVDSYHFSVAAKILTLTPIKTFTKKDNTEGKVFNLILADLTGQIFMSFWNEDTKMIAKMRELEEKVVLITNPKVKMGYGDQIEITYDIETKIVEIQDPKLEAIQSIKNQKYDEKPVTIGEITTNKAYVTTEGVITMVFSTKTFTRSDGTDSSIASFKIIDNTGEIRAVLWDENSEIIDELYEGAYVTLEGFAPKMDRKGEIELHATKISEVKMKAISDEEHEKNFHNLAFIKDKMYNITIRVKITEKEQLKELTRTNGSIASILNLKVEDLTDKARLSAWDEDIKKIDNFPLNTWIEITGVRSKITDIGKDLTLTKSSNVKEFKRK